MEKLFEIKRKLLKFLSKQPATILMFHKPTPNPCRSSPARVSIIPKEARRKHNKGGSFSAREPSSPKVSCMGQVQGKKKKKGKTQRKAQQISTKNNGTVENKKILLWIPKGSDEGLKREENGSATMEAPSLNTMKKFASGRGVLYDFDVTVAER
ncbi:uncharacterized protein At1g76070-like [Abrus precatorius]|uniref:Uncharacterized protein At1g76070-like n=1 Tax=Abrus precatorius TaxID=3816 RepID=A0A8B8M573_ABRPR|nr:uncharacterized protein At1g76070-like [Abrus precatorius]